MRAIMIVGVYFKGRLGNQLFQYAFLQFLRSKYPLSFFFFPNPHHASIQRYFDLSMEGVLMSSKVYSFLIRFLPKLLNFKNVFTYNFSAPRTPDFISRSIIHGYFQTDYFVRNSKIKTQFKVKDRYIKKFQEQFGMLFHSSKTIAVHIRRTDYLDYKKRNITIPIAYFRNQLLSIPNLQEYKVVFLSDDITYVKEQFGEQENYVYSFNSEIIDFQILQHVDIAIISNSSFAWWACYLNKNMHQRVIAPRYWLGFSLGREHPKGVMTDRFEWKDVLPINS